MEVSASCSADRHARPMPPGFAPRRRSDSGCPHVATICLWRRDKPRFHLIDTAEEPFVDM
jgi:hypothetical protein